MLIPLKTIDQVLTGVRQPPSPFLIAIVSRSEPILKWATLLITALGGSGSDVLQRNPDQPKWKDHRRFTRSCLSAPLASLNKRRGELIVYVSCGDSSSSGSARCPTVLAQAPVPPPAIGRCTVTTSRARVIRR